MNSKPCAIPSHRNSTTCCGRGDAPVRGKKSVPKWRTIGAGIRQYPDGHIERTPAALARHKDKLLRRGERCACCGEAFDDYREVELAHIESKGSGGWKRQDADSNLTLMHKSANRIQGSMSLEAYLAVWKPDHCKF